MNDNEPLTSAGLELQKFLGSMDLRFGKSVDQYQSRASQLLKWAKPTALLLFAATALLMLDQHWNGIIPDFGYWLALICSFVILVILDFVQLTFGYWAFKWKSGWTYFHAT
jgi:hypothetical protein